MNFFKRNELRKVNYMTGGDRWLMWLNWIAGCWSMDDHVILQSRPILPRPGDLKFDSNFKWPEPGPPQFAEVPALAFLGMCQTLGRPAGMTSFYSITSSSICHRPFGHRSSTIASLPPQAQKNHSNFNFVPCTPFLSRDEP
jgi:hypothetical protein